MFYQVMLKLQVFASMQDMLKVEENDTERLLQNIRDLGTQLYQNVSVFNE
jgi:hypothetical protein